MYHTSVNVFRWLSQLELINLVDIVAHFFRLYIGITNAHIIKLVCVISVVIVFVIDPNLHCYAEYTYVNHPKSFIIVLF